jgi:hypothetical protein
MELVDGFGAWIEALLRAGVLESGMQGQSPTVRMRAPYTIEFAETAIRRLNKLYNLDSEIGGVIGARPAVANGEVVLRVRRVDTVRNRSTVPWREYFPDSAEFSRALGSCLDGTGRGTRYLPVPFHSHPARRDDFPDHMSYFSGFYNLDTSERDRCNSHSVWTYQGRRMVFPRVLVCKPDENMFIGAYGGPATHGSFRSPMLNDLKDFLVDFGKGVKEATEGDPWARFVGILGVGGLGFFTALSASVPGGLQMYESQLLAMGVVSPGERPFAFTSGESVRVRVSAGDYSAPLRPSNGPLEAPPAPSPLVQLV